MKKKKIEAIPYMKLEKCSRDKKVLYIARTQLIEIEGEEHLFLEVYRNLKDRKEIPVVRYVATQKDWGMYETERGTWSRKKINSYAWGDGLCWYEERQQEGRGYQEKRKANLLYEEEDLKRIKKFFPDSKVWDDADWWEYFEGNEDKIKHQTWLRRVNRRKAALQERIENTPELKEKEILEFADKNIFFNKHFLYYKKRGRYVEVCCSKCGGVFYGRYKQGISYESQF